jgi:RND family efflux transporter MFP subunit
LVQEAHFTTNDQEGIKVRGNEDKITDSLNEVKTYLDAAKASKKYEDIKSSLSITKENLDIVFNSLKIIRDVCEEPLYEDEVSSSEKISLDTQRGHINTALTNIVNTQQAISSTELINTVNSNSYQAGFETAKGQLQAAEDELTKITASPRQEDIILYQAQVRQAEAKVQLLERQIEDTIMKSPVDGQVVKINKRVGELAMSSLQDGVITIFPSDPFEIEVNIYEEDIAKMNIGNPVEISLIAFPGEVFGGKVITIDPAEKVIDGVVYYEVSIGFNNDYPSGIKPGMTADIVIKTASKENVLVVPEEAIQKKNGTASVEVLENGNFKKKEINIGLQGTNYLVEVVSGLRQGEKIVIR